MTDQTPDPAPTTEGDQPLPAWFLAHGSPMLAVQDTPYTRTLAALSRRLRLPAAIVVVSAHWQTRGAVHVTSAPYPPTTHDFGGFDPSLFEISYPAPGEPTLAADIVRLVRSEGFEAAADAARGLDHGAWVPLRFVYPEASVPVVQVSLPFAAAPEALLRLGRALAPLRRRGVLVLGSGGVVHNLRTVQLEADDPPVPGWAAAFDRWVGERLAEMDIGALADYSRRGPSAAAAVPSPEHFQPLLVTLGAADPNDRVATLFEGFQHGTLSLRSISLETP